MSWFQSAIDSILAYWQYPGTETPFWEQFVYIYSCFIIFWCCLPVLTGIANTFMIRHLGDYPHAQAPLPKISCLIPARNEEENVGQCARSLCTQDYAGEWEVIVLNDHSTDRTGEILAALVTEYPQKLSVYSGVDLPEGWLGKHWACHQLTQKSTGDLLLFIDADTWHDRRTLTEAVDALIAEHGDMIAAIPHQNLGTWGEKLVMPTWMFGQFSAMPVLISHIFPLFVVTIGQFMMFRREPFLKIGGFEAVKTHIVDDIMLGRTMVNRGYRHVLVNGACRVECRMYRGFMECIHGFTKNSLAFFDYRFLLHAFVMLMLMLMFVEPFIEFVLWLCGLPTGLFVGRFLPLIIILGFMCCAIAIIQCRLPWYLTFMYPICVFMFAAVGIRSSWYTLTGQSVWKGRKLPIPKFRLC